MKRFILFFAWLSWLGVDQIYAQAQIIEPNDEEKLIIERFEYIRRVKDTISKLYWNDLSKEDFPGTIVYFSDSASYFIHPEDKMKEQVSSYKIMYNEYDWMIWKLRMPLDSAQFVMETQFQFDPKAKAYINYRTPVLFSSSPELTRKEKVHIGTTQEWSIALMHELYHQYQYSTEAIYTYILRLHQEKKLIDMDSLQSIYKMNQAFRDTLQLENELLKKAYAATSLEEEKELFKEFLRLRGKRNLDYFKNKKFYVTTPENLWEKLEGSCLMMERILKETIHKVPPTDYLAKHDPMYDPNFVFREESPEEVSFYTELKDENYYVGTTGYNLMRLLEKNKVPYKDNFYQYASNPLDLQLKYFYKIK